MSGVVVCLVGGSRCSIFLNMELMSSRGFMGVVTSGGRMLFLTDDLSVALRSPMVLQIGSYLEGIGSLRLP